MIELIFYIYVLSNAIIAVSSGWIVLSKRVKTYSFVILALFLLFLGSMANLERAYTGHIVHQTLLDSGFAIILLIYVVNKEFREKAFHGEDRRRTSL